MQSAAHLFMHSTPRTDTKRTFPDAAPPWPMPRWEATWIWSAESTEKAHDYVYFRRTFDAVESREPVLLRLAAERDATLWVNGQLIDHGPAISDPRFKRYQTYDITPHLSRAENCVAVRVYHDHTIAGFTAHADARGLLCQVEAGGRVLAASDASWRAIPAKAYLKPTPRMGDSMWAEVFDARLDTPGWHTVGFDDAAWPHAKEVIDKRHVLWGSQQPRTRFYPWVNLIPSETRPLRRTRRRPAELLRMGEVLQQREASPQDTAIRMSLESIMPLAKAAVHDADKLLSGDGPSIISNSPLDEPDDRFDGLRNATIVLDFGRLMNARLGMQLDAPGGQIDVGYASHLDDGRVVPYSSNRVANADCCILREGPQHWQTADWRHFRYVQLTFRNLSAAVTLHQVWAEQIELGLEPCGQFHSDDPKLDQLFEIVRRTTDLNTLDRTMDNPSRERKQYLGDCSGIVPAISAGFGDAAVLRRYFLNAREGQHATGLYRYSYPGHDHDHASLFDHSLSLPLRLWEHYQLFADEDLVREMWPSIERLLALCASCVDDQGMMHLPPYNIWFDWADMDRRGHFLPLQSMAAEVMRCSAELASVVGADATRWAASAQFLVEQVPRWFDAERGVFADSIVDGQRQSHLSEHAISLIAYWRQAPAAMIDACLDYWAQDPSRFGQASPAWFYLPAAFIRGGRSDLAIAWMHRRADQLQRQGLDTWPETWCLYGERTLGTWRCRNSRAIAQGAGLGVTTALLHDLCGIQPAEPGFRSVRLAPQPGSLTRLQGTRPGPDGLYALELQRHADRHVLQLTLPSPRRVTLDTRFAPDARQVLVNGQALPTEPTTTYTWQAETHSTIVVARAN